MNQTIELRPPRPEDGSSVFQLVKECPPLDPNSLYCNLLQCKHFSDTSVAAVMDGELVSFASGYLVPGRDDNTLFIWQVAVGEKARGRGLATKMVLDVLSRPQCSNVRYIETTITESNEASWALFRKISGLLDAELNTAVMFDRKTHFADQHDSEVLVRVGPFTPDQNLSA